MMNLLFQNLLYYNVNLFKYSMTGCHFIYVYIYLYVLFIHGTNICQKTEKTI